MESKREGSVLHRAGWPADDGSDPNGFDGIDDQRQWIDLFRPMDLRQCFLRTPHCRKVLCEPFVRSGIRGIELERSLELAFSTIPVPFVELLEVSERGVRLRQTVVDLQRPADGALCLCVC